METNPYSSPPETADVPRQSGVRNYCGWTLIALGLLLTLRIMSLAWGWWPLTEEELNRFVVLSIFGIMLALVGSWLRFRAVIFLLPIAILILIVGLLAIVG